MEAEDYIELNTLLAKLRVLCFKEIGKISTSTKERERNYRLVRNIDNIRKQIPLKINDDSILDTKLKGENK